METILLVIAVLTGAGLAFFRELRLKKKIQPLENLKVELAQINKRLSRINQQKTDYQKELDLQSEILRRELDKLATVKFVKAYTLHAEKEPYWVQVASSDYFLSSRKETRSISAEKARRSESYPDDANSAFLKDSYAL